jgi:hypothetical protein
MADILGIDSDLSVVLTVVSNILKITKKVSSSLHRFAITG